MPLLKVAFQDNVAGPQQSSKPTDHHIDLSESTSWSSSNKVLRFTTTTPRPRKKTETSEYNR